MRRNQIVLKVADEERRDLERLGSRTLPAGNVFHAPLILGLADGQT
jgi:hypothetical protein